MEDELGRAYNMYEGYENAHKMLIGKPEGERQHRRPRHRWEDIILGK